MPNGRQVESRASKVAPILGPVRLPSLPNPSMPLLWKLRPSVVALVSITMPVVLRGQIIGAGR